MNSGHTSNQKHSGIRSSGPMVDRNPGLADLDCYNLRIERISTELESYGDQTNMIANMEIRLDNRSKTGSQGVQQVEQLVTDIKTLNNIKRSKHPGITELWGQLNTLMALTKETDK